MAGMMGTPFAALAEARRENGLPFLFRAQIVGEILIGSTEELKISAFIYTIRPLVDIGAGCLTGNVFTAVQLFECFANPQDPKVTQVTAYHRLPIGAYVLCAWDGFVHVIVGCLSGPFRSTTETALDSARMTVSFNPGIGAAVHRAEAQLGLDVPDWSFPVEPGDHGWQHGTARMLVGARGALIGGDLDNFVLYKTDGERLDRAGFEIARRYGYYRTFQGGSGLPEIVDAAAQHSRLAPDNTAEWARQVEVFWPTSRSRPGRTYFVRARGFIPECVSEAGASLAKFRHTSQEVVDGVPDSLVAHDFAVAQDSDDTPDTTFKEIGPQGSGHVVYDLQVGSNGSLRIRSGNQKRAKKGQTKRPTGEMDFSFEFDADKGIFHLRVGRAGAEDHKITVGPAGVNLTTKSKLYAKASDGIEFVGNVQVTGTLDVSDSAKFLKDITSQTTITAVTDVQAGGNATTAKTSLVAHIHKLKHSGDTVTLPPTPPTP